MIPQIILQVVTGLAVLGILIFVHELGHFLLAKWCGVGVLEFSIGFGKKLWQRRFGDTRYSLGLIPLGGYVRMVGDDPREYGANSEEDEASSSPSAFLMQEIEEEDSPRLKALLADESRWFVRQGYWKKFAIVAAGPGFNFLFALIVTAFTIYAYGVARPVEDALIGGVAPGKPAEHAGMQKGDKVVSIDGQPVTSWEILAETVMGSGGKPMQFVFEREVKPNTWEQQTVEITGEPADDSHRDLELLLGEEGPKTPRFVIGIHPLSEQVSVGFLDSWRRGARHVWFLSVMTLRSLKLMLTGQISAKNIAGPVSIVDMAYKQAQQGHQDLLFFMVFLSVSLAVLNLLPIPILDGGHLVFFTLEAIKGGPLSMKTQDYASQIGLLILMALMIFAVGNDLYRLSGLAG